jgi:hypothetical protein
MPWDSIYASLALDAFPLKKTAISSQGVIKSTIAPSRSTSYSGVCHPLPHQHSPLGQLTPNTDAVHLIGTQH